MMNEAIFQQICNELSQYLLPGLSRLVIYLEYGEGSYCFSFYEKISEKYVKCYDLPGVTDDSLVASFDRINDIVAGVRRDGWTSMTMVVDAEGRMHADFDYTEASEDEYLSREAWKRKYLI